MPGVSGHLSHTPAFLSASPGSVPAAALLRVLSPSFLKMMGTNLALFFLFWNCPSLSRFTKMNVNSRGVPLAAGHAAGPQLPREDQSSLVTSGLTVTVWPLVTQTPTFLFLYKH